MPIISTQSTTGLKSLALGDSVTTLGGNTTQVDQFGLPMLLVFEGTDPTNNQPTIKYAGFQDKRSTMMGSYANLGSPWTNLMLVNGGGTKLRVIAPYHASKWAFFRQTKPQ